MKRKWNVRRVMAAALAAVLAVGILGSAAAIRLLYPRTYREEVERYARQYDLDAALLFAVIRTESSFQPTAVSEAGAIGLTQITEETYDWIRLKLGETGTFHDLFEPEHSIRFGAYYLSYLKKKFGSDELAAAAYHAGAGRVSAWLADETLSPDGKTLSAIPVTATAHYVKKIIKCRNIYSRLCR